MQRDIESLITQYVNRYNSGENVDRTYRNSLQAAGNLNLQDVSREDIEQVMRPFLYSWGRMGRILGQSKFADWRENLAQAARRNASLLERYRATDLADAKLNTERPLIEHLYDSFRNAVGQVAATKSLHLLSPGFFPMWDTAIALSARKERGGGSVTVVAAQEFSKEDYCLLYTSPSPRDRQRSRMPSSA